MSYPIFLIVWLSTVVTIGVALAGPFSALSVVAFWVGHYFFLEWRNKSAPLDSMSDSELHDVFDWWTGKGPFGRNTPDLSRVRSRGNEDELKAALKRVISIYDEKIKRNNNFNIDTSEHDKTRKHLFNELEKLSKNKFKEN